MFNTNLWVYLSNDSLIFSTFCVQAFIPNIIMLVAPRLIADRPILSLKPFLFLDNVGKAASGNYTVSA